MLITFAFSQLCIQYVWLAFFQRDSTALNCWPSALKITYMRMPG